MATQIKFGTSGWRAIVAEEFTFANVRRAVTGIARYVAEQKSSGARVIVARDPRFLGETFCSIAAEILGAHGNCAAGYRRSRTHSSHQLRRNSRENRWSYQLHRLA